MRPICVSLGCIRGGSSMSKTIALLCLACIVAVPAFAQLAPFNEKGVAIGHVHLIVKDPEAQKKLWVELFGAEVAHAGALELLKLPGTIILLTKGDPVQEGEPTADHFALAVRDFAAIKSKLAAAGIQLSERSIAVLPEGVRVEILEDKNLNVPVAFHHFHIFSNNPALAQWYEDIFGIRFPAGNGFPGGEVRLMVQQDPPRVATKGHVFDHISFEVTDLDEFCKKLEAKNVKLDMRIVEAKQIGLKVTFVTDPAGTRIELTQGLAGR